MIDSAYKIQSLKWIKKTNLKKVYPNKLIVSVIENEPFAYFLDDQKIFLIDSDGEKIREENNIEKFDQYLVLSGIDSDLNIATLVKNINIFYSEILSSINEIEFIEKRRWNIILKNELKVKLSERVRQNFLSPHRIHI